MAVLFSSSSRCRRVCAFAHRNTTSSRSSIRLPQRGRMASDVMVSVWCFTKRYEIGIYAALYIRYSPCSLRSYRMGSRRIRWAALNRMVQLVDRCPGTSRLPVRRHSPHKAITTSARTSCMWPRVSHWFAKRPTPLPRSCFSRTCTGKCNWNIDTA